MHGPSGWPVAEPIDAPRLILEPLRVAHAEAILLVLADHALYEHTGGGPLSLGTLRPATRGRLAGARPTERMGG
ncbi:MAG: hypothetical protein ACLPZR_31120 [Solirubrobacteraceae bacterium]